MPAISLMASSFFGSDGVIWPKTSVSGYSALQANHLHTTASTGSRVQPLSLPSIAAAGDVPGRLRVGSRVVRAWSILELRACIGRELGRLAGTASPASGGETPSLSGCGALNLRGCDATGRYAAAACGRPLPIERRSGSPPTVSSATRSTIAELRAGNALRLVADAHAQHQFVRLQPRVGLRGSRLHRLGVRLPSAARPACTCRTCGRRRRSGSASSHSPQLLDERRHRLEPLALPRPVERHARTARVQRAVLGVLHDHDAVAPAVEAEVVARREAAREAGVGVVDEHAVAVGDDAVRGGRSGSGSRRRRSSRGSSTAPGRRRASSPAAALGLVDAVRAVRVDQRREGVGLRDDLRLLGATDGAREKREQQE